MSASVTNSPISSTPVIHPGRAGLLTQIQLLEAQLIRLEEEKAGIQSLIDQYYRLFQRQLGELLLKTAEIQMQLALRRASQTGRRSDSEEARNRQEQFAQTNRAIQEAVAHQPAALDDTAERELRRLYRQAATLAHPDRHGNDPGRLAQATAFMARLNDAYKRQDLAAVRALAQQVTEGQLFWLTIDTEPDLDALQQWHGRLVDRQVKLLMEIQHLKTEEACQLMTSGGDLTAHFSNLRRRMQQQIDNLQQLLRAS